MKIQLERIEEPFVMELTNDSGSKVKIDAASHIGGKNQGFRPMELLASSLAGCMAIDILSIMKKKRVDLKHFAIQIEAQRKDGIPSPFESIHFEIEVDVAVDVEKLKHAADLSHEKYCSVWASLNPEIAFTYAIKTV